MVIKRVDPVPLKMSPGVLVFMSSCRGVETLRVVFTVYIVRKVQHMYMHARVSPGFRGSSHGRWQGGWSCTIVILDAVQLFTDIRTELMRWRDN